jgi:hypothetical protein
MEQAPLLQRTLDLLQNCELSLAEIATKSNLGVEWLKKLKGGSIPDPSVRRIQRLHDFLLQHAAAAEAEAPQT